MAKAKGIYRRGNKYWIRYAGLDGKMVYESSGSEKFRDAEALLIQRRQSIKEGKQPHIKRIANYTFGQLAEQYLEWIKGRQASVNVKRSVISKHLERYANIPLRMFTTAVVEQLQSELIGKDYRNAYTNKVLRVLKGMFTKAVEWDYVEDETLRRVRKVRLLREDKHLRYLSIDECQALINACSPYLRPIVIIALYTGMRKSEILNLKWSNIDLANNLILLDRTKNGERREIPINATARNALLTLPRRLDGGLVFSKPRTGKPVRNVNVAFNLACKRAKIIDFRFHDCRHTFASQLVMSGVDLATVSSLLGHKHIAMTMRYSHLAPAHRAKAVEILDEALNGNYTRTIQSGGCR